MTMYEVITVFKGIVYPKNLTLSSFTHPRAISKLYFFLLLNPNKDILKSDSDQVPSVFYPYNGRQLYPQLFVYQHSLKYLPLSFKKKCVQVWNDMRVMFGVDCPFKSLS